MDNRAPIEAVLKKRDRSTGYRWTKEILGLLDNAGVFQAAVTSGAPAPHAKGTDVEAALDAIEALLYAVEQGHINAAALLHGSAEKALATLRAALDEAERERNEARAALNERSRRLRETTQILIEEVGADGPMDSIDAARKAVEVIVALRAALAELEDGHLTIARAIGMVDEDQGRIASVATAEAIAGAIGELRRTDDAKTDEWMCAGREAALAEKADNVRVRNGDHPTGQFVGVQPSPAGQHWYDMGFDAGRETALAALVDCVERSEEPVYWRCPECGDAPDISGRWRWLDQVPEHHHGYPVGHIRAERVQDDPPADPARVTVGGDAPEIDVDLEDDGDTTFSLHAGKHLAINVSFGKGRVCYAWTIGDDSGHGSQLDPGGASKSCVTVDRELLGSVLCLLGSLSSVAAVEAADAICTLLAGPERQPEGGA